MRKTILSVGLITYFDFQSWNNGNNIVFRFTYIY